MCHALLFRAVCACLTNGLEMTPWSSLSRPTYGHLVYYLCCSSVPALAAASLPCCGQTSIEMLPPPIGREMLTGPCAQF